MKTTTKTRHHHAKEQEDGTFVVGKHSLSRQEFEILMKLQGESWIIFTQPGSTGFGGKQISFDLAK